MMTCSEGVGTTPEESRLATRSLSVATPTGLVHPGEGDAAGAPAARGLGGRQKRARPRVGPSATLARLLSNGLWSPVDLVELLGSGWADEPDQAEALAALLRLAIPPAHHVALSDVWTEAIESVRCSGPLDRSAASRLLKRWQARAQRRADEWRRPRSQRPKKAGRCELPAGALAGQAA